MKAIALAALAASALAQALAADVESKHEFKGTDEDYSKAVHQARIGYETKVGALTPYIEGGVGAVYPDGSSDSDAFTALEVGSKVKIMIVLLLMVSLKQSCILKKMIGKSNSAPSTSSDRK